MEKLKVDRNKFNETELEPLFFFNRVPSDAHSQENIVWKPSEYFFLKNPDLRITFDGVTSYSNTLLTFGRKYVHTESKEKIKDYSEDEKDCPENEIWFDLEPFGINNPVHLKTLFSLAVKKSGNHNDCYYFKELLWVLNNFFFTKDHLINALSEFKDEKTRCSLLNIVSYVSYCLSPKKQHIIKEILGEFGIIHKVYFPEKLEESLSVLFRGVDFNESNTNIFGLIRVVLLKEEYKKSKSIIIQAQKEPEQSDNLFINLRKWLRDSSFLFTNFEELTSFFRLLDPDIQLLVIRRYFEAVRLKQTSLDLNIIKSFKDNKFENWARYYHCAHTPSQPVNLCIPLLCEMILTALDSKGTRLVTLNGIIDLALQRAENIYPKIDPGLRRLFPTCLSNAVLNPSFEGFISFLTVYKLKVECFSSNFISEIQKRALSLIGQRQAEHICTHPKFNLDNCLKRIESQDQELECRVCPFHKHRILDKWKIVNTDDNFKILNLFSVNSIESGDFVYISLDDFSKSPELFKQRLVSLLNEVVFETGVDRNQVNSSYNGTHYTLKVNASFNLTSIIGNFLTPVGCIIEPKKNAYIGCGVLDINKRMEVEKFTSPEKQMEENKRILPLIEKRLRDEFQLTPTKGNLYFLPYKADLFSRLRASFYADQDHINSDSFDKYNSPFLISRPFHHDIFCAPSANYSKDLDYNSTVNLPFYRCRGKECYKSRLTNQTLATVTSWKEYSLLHILEILGFPLVSQQSDMPVAHKVLADTIAIVNKSEIFFNRMTCQECGHLLFPSGSNKFNQYNYFECRILSCNEKFKKIYLNYCFRCVKGLIDSRISKKCPDGWYICPDCQSCCDSSIYRRMADRYIRYKMTVPPHIAAKLEHAHNDSGLYFCYKCGSPLSVIKNQEDNSQSGYCAECNKFYKLRKRKY